MGILNLSQDSFYDGGKHNTTEGVLLQAEKMLNEGATFIDLGAASSKPGSKIIRAEEEMEIVLPILQALQDRFPTVHFSIDTYNHSVAHACLNAGASMINDISGGTIDPKMHTTVAKFSAPYVMMHMQGTPETMQNNPTYEDVVTDILSYFSKQTKAALWAGIHDVVVDPGFGFGKNHKQNFKLLNHLKQFQILGCPILMGISRKSMIYKFLNTSSNQALNGTTALHAWGLERGANILRVHDVKQAKECIDLWGELQ
ncbi:MAG: dihydropteroate synthase [Flavobacteriaceae bacterium]|jgi:dihydropteroate synthase